MERSSSIPISTGGLTVPERVFKDMVQSRESRLVKERARERERKREREREREREIEKKKERKKERKKIGMERDRQIDMKRDTERAFGLRVRFK